MKKTILSILFFGLLFTACENKSGKKNSPVIENTPDTNPKTHLEEDQESDAEESTSTAEFLYKSESGEIISISFFEEDDEKFVQVKRDGKPAIVLEQISASENTAIYEKDNNRFIRKNNEATFTNGINFLKLTLISPLKYIYTDGQEEITITYFSNEDKRFVTIQKDDQSAITLEQTTAWAKGAEYGKGTVKWHSQKNTGTLIQDGIKTEFKEKE